MSKFILITGGARSGKSRFAEKMAAEQGEKVVYIATAIAFDEGMKDRIKKHQQDRPQIWKTIERYKDFNALKEDRAFIESDCILLDCVTLMVTNLMLESNLDFDNCSMEDIDVLEQGIFKEIEILLDITAHHHKDAIIVTNEVGMGLVPAYRMGNIFRDIAGRVNQYIAGRADEVYLTVSGIEMKIK